MKQIEFEMRAKQKVIKTSIARIAFVFDRGLWVRDFAVIGIDVILCVGYSSRWGGGALQLVVFALSSLCFAANAI